MLVTRPKDQNKGLIKAIEVLGITSIVLPTLEIRPIKNIEATLDFKIENILPTIKLIILVSQNVVWALSQKWVDSILAYPSIRIITMGEATTQAAEHRGLKVSYTPSAGSTSEQLLESIFDFFPITSGDSVLILTGEGGRDFLEQVLKQKGARIYNIPLYTRHCPEYSDAELETIFKFCLAKPAAPADQLPRTSDSLGIRGGDPAQVILVTSQQGLDNLLKIVEGFSAFDLEAALGLKGWKVVVPSVRVQTYAYAQGFGCVVVAASARDDAMLDAGVRLALAPEQLPLPYSP